MGKVIPFGERKKVLGNNQPKPEVKQTDDLLGTIQEIYKTLDNLEEERDKE